MADMQDQIKIGVDSSGVETGVGRIKRSMSDLGRSVSDAGKRGGEGFKQIDRGGQVAANNLDSVTRRMVNSLQRQIAAAEAGGAATRSYQESIARLRGANLDVLRPYLDQLDEANKKTDEAKRKANLFGGALSGVMGRLTGLAVGLATAISFKKFIDETIAAEHAQAQLHAVLKSTGESAGWSIDQLNKMAQGLSRSSVFSADQIRVAEARLLSYTGIVGEQFPRAMQSVIDMSTRMGTDVASSAEQIGRALDVPSQGLTSLTRQGFRFTEEQKKLVEELENTGRVAEAQSIVLEALESSYGGAASAARDTLGGALAALKNNIGDLMAGGDGSVNGLTRSINELNHVLQSDETKKAFAFYTGLLADVTTVAVKFTNAFALALSGGGLGGAVGALTKTEDVNKELARTEAALAGVKEQLDGLSRTRIGRFLNADDIALAKRQIEHLIAKRDQLLRMSTPQAEDHSYGSPSAIAAANAAAEAAAKAEQTRNEARHKAMNDLLGVSQQYQEKLTELQRLQQSGALTEQEYAQAVSKLATETYAATDAGKAAAEAARARGKASDDAAKASQREAQSYGAFISAVQSKIAAIELELAGGAKLTESQRMQLQLEKQIADGKLHASRAEQAATKAALDALSAREADLQLQKEQEKASKELADARERELGAARQSVGTLADHNARLKEGLATLGLSRTELVAYERAQIDATIARKRDTLAAIEALDPTNERLDLLREEIGLLEERSGLLGATELKRQEQEIADSWAQTVKSMGDQFTDALIQGGASIKDALKRMFQNLVLRPIIAPIMAGLAGSLMPGSAMAGQGGGLGGLSSFLTGGGLTDSATAFISNLGSKIGGDIGAKLMMNSQFLGSIAGAAGNAFIGYGLSKGLSGGYSAGSWVNTAAGIASAIPGIGPIAGLVGAAVNRLFGRKFKDAGIYGEFSGDSFSGGSYEYYKGGLFRSNKTNETAFDDAISRQLTQDWQAITGSIRTFADALSLEADRIEGFTHEFKISMGKPSGDEAEQAFADAWAEALRTGSNELAQQLIGTLEQTTEEVTRWARDLSVSEWGEYTQVTETVEAMTYVASEFARDGEEAIDTLTRLGTSIIAANEVFDALGLSMYEASLAGGDMASQLIDLFGGVEVLVASTASYYDKFFTEQEKFAHTLGQVKGVFAELNQELPLSHAAFRDIVESLDLTTESGREAFAALMGVSDAFAALVPDLAAVAGDLSSILTDGLLGTFDGDDVGAALANALTGGIENAIAGHFVGQITNILVSGIVEPMVAAAATGATVSTAVSSAAMDEVVSHARAVMAQMNAVLGELRDSGALDEIGSMVSGLFPSVRVSTPRVQSFASAVSSSSKAADSAAKEAERLAQAWRRLSDTLMDEVARIRGAIADTAANSLDYWQAQFAITTAQARAGDQDAAGNLTGLSRALLTAAEAQAGSLLELQQLRAQVAQSLQDTAGYASAFGGGQSVTTQSGSLSTPGGAQTRPTTITIPPSPAATQRVIVQPDPHLVAEVKLLREVVQAQGDAMRDMQHELVRYARRWDADGLPVVEVTA